MIYHLSDEITYIAVAILYGGILGFERERKDKSASVLVQQLLPCHLKWVVILPGYQQIF